MFVNTLNQLKRLLVVSLIAVTVVGQMNQVHADDSIQEDKSVEGILSVMEAEGYRYVGTDGLDALSLAENGESVTEVSVKEEVDRVLGYNELEAYIEFLPFNYDARAQKVSVVADHSMIIMPFAQVVDTQDISVRQNLEMSATSDKNFEILSNTDGTVVIKMSSLVKSGKSYYYKLYEGDNEIKGKTKFSGDTITERFSKRSVYAFEIYKSNSLWFDEKVWEAEIYVEPAPLTSQETQMLDDLAQQYAPILTLSENEKYKPIAISDILSNSSYKIAVTTIDGTERVNLTALNHYLRYNGYSKGLLEGHWGLGTNSDSLESMNIDGYESNVYYSYVDVGNAYLINYHFIYNFDPKTPSTSVGAHNFDREQIGITFDKSSLKPIRMYYPQHLIAHSMGLLTDDEKSVPNVLQDGSSWVDKWQGYTVLSYDEAKSNNLVVEGTHPIISIALGSHAPFPIGGVYVANGFNEPAGLVEGNAIEEDHFLIPSSVYQNKPSSSVFDQDNKYNLTKLDIEHIVSGGSYATDTNYLAYCGYWVDVVGVDNAKFPPYLAIMKNPEGYVNESMKDNSHEFKMAPIPQSIKDRATRIMTYLDGNL